MNEGLLGSHRRYTVELFAQGRCTQDSITPGQGAHLLASAKLETDVFGGARETITIPGRRFQAGESAYTATATGPDGSTSEFSPCLTRGHHAASFAAAGVNVQQGPIPITFSPGPAADAAVARRHAPTHRIATIKLLCPPNTTRLCAGSVTISLLRNHHRPLRITKLAFRLAPGELGAVTFRLSKAIYKALGKPGAHFKLRVTITAHDGSRHPLTFRFDVEQ